MKTLLISIYFAVVGLNVISINKTETVLNEVKFEKSFSLINDTKEKVTIHTGTGIVSLNNGSKTSIGCNVGKEVRWANDANAMTSLPFQDNASQFGYAPFFLFLGNTTALPHYPKHFCN